MDTYSGHYRLPALEGRHRQTGNPDGRWVA